MRTFIGALRARDSHAPDASAARAFWSGLEGVAAPVASLLVAAGLVRALGTQDYGLLVVVLAVSSLSTAINPAIAASTTRFVSASVGSHACAGESIRRIVIASLMTVTVIGLIFLSAVDVFLGPLSRLLFGPSIVSQRADAGWILMLGVLTVCVQQVDAVFAAGLKGLERFKPQALFELVSRIGTAVAMIAVGRMTRSIEAVLVASCVLSALSGLFRALTLRAVIPGGRLFQMPRLSELTRLSRFGGWMWLNATATVAYGTVDRVIVGRVLGTAMAAEFHIYVQLSQLVHYIPSSLLAFAFPVFSRMSASGPASRALIARTHLKLSIACVTVIMVIAPLLLFFRHDLADLLAGGMLSASADRTLVYLIVGFSLLALNIVPYHLLLGLGRSKLVSLVTTASIAGAIAATPVLVHDFGLEGAAIARLIYAIGTLTLLVFATRALAKT